MTKHTAKRFARMLSATYTVRADDHLLCVYFDAERARAGFGQAWRWGLHPRDLRTPLYGNSSFELPISQE